MKPGYWEWPSDKKLKEMESRAGTLAEVVQRDQCELFEEGALVASSCCYLVKLIRRRAGGR